MLLMVSVKLETLSITSLSLVSFLEIGKEALGRLPGGGLCWETPPVDVLSTWGTAFVAEAIETFSFLLERAFWRFLGRVEERAAPVFTAGACGFDRVGANSSGIGAGLA